VTEEFDLRVLLPYVCLITHEKYLQTSQNAPQTTEYLSVPVAVEHINMLDTFEKEYTRNWLKMQN
jgi:hypothetical protein